MEEQRGIITNNKTTSASNNAAESLLPALSNTGVGDSVAVSDNSKTVHSIGRQKCLFTVNPANVHSNKVSNNMYMLSLSIT